MAAMGSSGEGRDGDGDDRDGDGRPRRGTRTAATETKKKDAPCHCFFCFWVFFDLSFSLLFGTHQKLATVNYSISTLIFARRNK